MRISGFNEYTLLMEAAQRFKMHLPKEIMELFNLFKKNNYKLYVVGGAVRDALLGKKPKDYDVATDATPNEIEKIIDGKYKTIDGGKSKDLGVTIIIMNGEQFEIATFREETYRDGNFQEFIRYINQIKPSDYEKRLRLFIDMSVNK
jgi:tRNA nucleotidyltransferase/poly(A) polymerase